jgi:uncharacterized protein (TIGR00255 family)
MRSMTGFGASTKRDGALTLSAEVRSVNHRYLQLKTRLPADLSFLEPEVEALVRERLDRGAVTVAVSSSGSGALAPLELDLALAKRYAEMLAKLARALGRDDSATAADIARMPGVLAAEPDARAVQRARKLALDVVDAALDDLEEMREREGKALAKDLARHAAEMKRLALGIERRMPRVVRGHQQALEKRVGELLGSTTAVAPADLAREIALIADRLDVSEEVSRLASHLAQFANLLAKDGAVGRQLEFLVQELLREANTIGSKCNDAEVAHVVVELKTAIERSREQVQNVE